MLYFFCVWWLIRTRGSQSSTRSAYALVWAHIYIFWSQRNLLGCRWVYEGWAGESFIWPWNYFSLMLLTIIRGTSHLTYIPCCRFQTVQVITMLIPVCSSLHWLCLVLFLILWPQFLKERLKKNPYYLIRCYRIAKCNWRKSCYFHYLFYYTEVQLVHKCFADTWCKWTIKAGGRWSHHYVC